MPVVSYDRVKRRLEEGGRGGVFFLFGEDSYLKSEAASAIAEAHVDPATRDFNLDELSAKETAAETVASIFETPPMMAEWRVVIVRETEALAGSSRDRAMIERLLDRSMPGLAVILVADIPRRSKAKFYKRLKKDAVAMKFGQLSEDDAPGWIMARARAEGIELDGKAARALAAAVGPETGVLVRELAKLREYTADRGRITTEDVETAVGRTVRVNRWDWFDRVGKREFARARSELPALLDSRETGVGLVIGLGTHMLRLAVALHGGRRALESELPRNQRWLARRLVSQVRGWDGSALDAVLDDLLRADRLLKSTALGEERIMDELLLRIQTRVMEVAA